MYTNNNPHIMFGQRYLEETMKQHGYDMNRFSFIYYNEHFDEQTAGLLREGQVKEQGFIIKKTGPCFEINASSSVGILYALIEIADRISDGDKEITNTESNLEIIDAPYMKYRGYCLGLQKPVAYYEDHKSYDWPITPDNFPWFYDRKFLIRLLDKLVKHRINVLYLWNGHPFASLVKLDEYPEAPEVSKTQLKQNINHYRWFCTEAHKRGIWIVQKFYNIHMSDPLAKSRGWQILAGVAHQGICDYTRACIKEFIRTYPSVGLMACMGEVIREEDKAKWLKLILESVLEGLGPEPTDYPPVIIRTHSINLEKYLPDAMKIYPNIVTEMKHNNESYISTKPDSGNTVLARLSGQHIINVHLCANLEPFAWGSPRFIRRTVMNMLKYEASGIHIYPLRYWDWPNSAHKAPLGDQLKEHSIWWSAWGRYSWNPYRDEKDEDIYWKNELKREYGLNNAQAEALLYALQETGPVLPQIAGQFIITSGNGQCINLGQHIVTMAFSRQEFQDGGGYSMAQLCGFPIIGEIMWTQSPVSRMKRMMKKCDLALEMLRKVEPAPIIEYTFKEIEIMNLIARYYFIKARSCSIYFQCLYGMPGADESEALKLLEESLDVYKELAEKTEVFFKDASSLHHYRRLPAYVEEGYYSWKDVLPIFERELEIARKQGIKGLLAEAAKRAKYVPEWNSGMLTTDEI